MNNNISSLYNTLQDGVNDVQSRIAKTSNELASGKQPLSKQDASVVARLSNTALSQSGIKANITNANNLIDVSQTGLSSVATILTEMKGLAVQISDGLSNEADQASLLRTFRQLSSQVDGIAATTNINGNNLLSGGQSISVVSATDGSNNQTTTIQGIDIPSLQAQINDLPFDGGSDQIKQSATTAITLLNQFISNISSAQSSLTAAKDSLDVSLSTSNDVALKAQKTVDQIQNVDITALQMQLQQLNNQQTLDFQVTSQLRSMASSILSIFR